MINLQDFVSEALAQVVQGVKNAQARVAESGAMINPKGHVVDSGGQVEGANLVSERPKILVK